MKIGIPKETQPGETRVALIPSLLPTLLREKHEVFLEAGAGVAAGFTDDQYAKAGAHIVRSALLLYKNADVVWKVQPPRKPSPRGKHEAELLREEGTYFGYLAPLTHPDILQIMAKRVVGGFLVTDRMLAMFHRQPSSTATDHR